MDAVGWQRCAALATAPSDTASRT